VKNTGLGNYFLNSTPIGQEIRTRTDKWDGIKLTFCPSKGSYQNPETTHSTGESFYQLFNRQGINTQNNEELKNQNSRRKMIKLMNGQVN
jgi:hypothetical protein